MRLEHWHAERPRFEIEPLPVIFLLPMNFSLSFKSLGSPHRTYRQLTSVSDPALSTHTSPPPHDLVMISLLQINVNLSEQKINYTLPSADYCGYFFDYHQNYAYFESLNSV